MVRVAFARRRADCGHGAPALRSVPVCRGEFGRGDATQRHPARRRRAPPWS